MQSTTGWAKALELQRKLIDSLFILILIIASHYVNIFVEFLSKMIFGNFEFEAVMLKAFGLVEITYIQISPIDQINRVMVYLSPFIAYIVMLSLGLAVYSRLKGILRLFCAWIIAFSFLYCLHASFVGLIFQGGGLGTIEDQVGHRGYSISLFLALITITFVFLFRHKHSPGKPNILSIGLVIFPLYLLFSYNFMTFTESASIIYKVIFALFYCLIAIIYGKVIESHFLPKRSLSKLLTVSFVVLALCGSFLLHYQVYKANDVLLEKLRNKPFPNLHYTVFKKKEEPLRKLTYKSFPNFEDSDSLANGIIVSDENLNRVLVVYSDGTVKTFIDNFFMPEVVYYDKTKQRLLIAGPEKLQIFETPLDNIPEKEIDLTSIENVEFLIDNHSGFIAGYDPNHIIKISENGKFEPLINNLENTDSILSLGNDNYLIGSGKPSHHQLHILNTKTKNVSLFNYEGEVGNVECILRDRSERIWLCMGNSFEKGARLALIDKQNHISVVFYAADVEGIVQTKDNQIAFSDDIMNTVYKISNRGGIYPLVHLHDPDDLVVIEDRT